MLKARLLAYFFRGVLRCLLWTCRFQVKGGENLTSLNKRAIIALWHNRLLLIGPAILKVAPKQPFCAFISKSKDADVIAEYTTSYSIGRVIRVPHDAKNSALKAMIGRLKFTQDIAIITPDGPRGPLYQVKPGVCVAAKETGATIIPFSYDCNRYWELGTWDKMRIPKPFSTIVAKFGKGIDLDKDSPLEEDVQIIKIEIESLS